MFSSSPGANMHKNGAHAAHCRDLFESKALIVGSVEWHTMPMGCPEETVSLDSSWTPHTEVVRVRCL